MKRLPVVIALFDCGRTDRHDRANLSFWQILCERDKFGRRRILLHRFSVHYLLSSNHLTGYDATDSALISNTDLKIRFNIIIPSVTWCASLAPRACRL
jgi:hypothetical protein